MRASSVPIILLAATLAACATTRAVPRPYPGGAAPDSGPPSADAGRVPERPLPSPPPRDDNGLSEPAMADSVAGFAEALLGTPYRSGGTDPGGFDCSGFVQYVFARAGIVLPRSVRELWRVGDPVEPVDVRRGDLVFFAIGGAEVSHVGIALDGATFVHAPSARGVVRIERSGGTYWTSHYAGARRVVVTE